MFEGMILALGLSMHTGLANDYNEFHPHIRFIEDGVISGVYHNSIDRTSFYAGYRMEMGDAGIEFAGVTGYPAFGDVAPFIRATYDLGDSIRMFATPAVENYSDYDARIGVVLGFEFMIK